MPPGTLKLGSPTVVGGLRSRLIFDSTFKVVNDGLTALGWFGAGRHHQPITVIPEEVNTAIEVPMNTLAVSDENVSDTPQEMGSVLAEFTRYFYVDFFAESDELGKHVIGDVHDILEGRMPSIGRAYPIIPVYDFRMGASPTVMFACDVMSVRTERAHMFNQPWLRHWWSVQFQLIDYYTNESG